MLNNIATITTTHDMLDDATNNTVIETLRNMGFSATVSGADYDLVNEQPIFLLDITSSNTNWTAAAEYLNGTVIG